MSQIVLSNGRCYVIDSKTELPTTKSIDKPHHYEIYQLTSFTRVAVSFVCYIFDKYKAKSALVICLTDDGAWEGRGGQIGVISCY